ncbi:MAG TPA: STAS domain-containing protein [Leptospiraceae bacterium]|nr:STAS domain-containing protein [Leptospiraceae bacterium]HMW08533.1 STAS domain-containing protein [Leptospiraceae bacterium]HMX34870.1 STAS domain-containing protein [Leptospiraceae bacterium]HMY34220.1 STAS domain-containing protein [Leptospiraceae bacterium]HMZ66528.1 STAS domain-containing protein [Leptospiraceae bacterium]
MFGLFSESILETMKIDLDLKPPFAIFHFSGKLAFTELASIRAKLNPILREAKHKIVFDLKELESIDSSGVALLFHVAQEATNYKDGSFSLTAPGDFVKEVMVLSGIYNKFIIHPTVDEALRN